MNEALPSAIHNVHSQYRNAIKTKKTIALKYSLHMYISICSSIAKTISWTQLVNVIGNWASKTTLTLNSLAQMHNIIQKRQLIYVILTIIHLQWS